MQRSSKQYHVPLSVDVEVDPVPLAEAGAAEGEPVEPRGRAVDRTVVRREAPSMSVFLADLVDDVGGQVEEAAAVEVAPVHQRQLVGRGRGGEGSGRLRRGPLGASSRFFEYNIPVCLLNSFNCLSAFCEIPLHSL